MAKTKKIADQRLERLGPDRDRTVDDAARRGQFLQALLQADEELVLDPGRVLRLLVQLLLRGGNAAERLVDLVDRARHDQPQQQRDRADDRQVVERQAERPRHLVDCEPVDARPHRGGQDQAEEDERQHDLHLPEREHADDHGDRDQGRDEGSAGSFGHLRLLSPRGDCRKRRRAAASGEAGRAMVTA